MLYDGKNNKTEFKIKSFLNLLYRMKCMESISCLVLLVFLMPIFKH